MVEDERLLDVRHDEIAYGDENAVGSGNEWSTLPFLGCLEEC